MTKKLRDPLVREARREYRDSPGKRKRRLLWWLYGKTGAIRHFESNLAFSKGNLEFKPTNETTQAYWALTHALNNFRDALNKEIRRVKETPKDGF